MPFSKFTGGNFRLRLQRSTFKRNSTFQQRFVISASNTQLLFSTLNCDCSFQPQFSFSTLNSTAIQLFNAQMRLQLSTAIPTFNRDWTFQRSSAVPTFYPNLNAIQKARHMGCQNSGTSTSSKATFKCSLHFQRPTVPVTAIYYEWLLKIINGFYYNINY